MFPDLAFPKSLPLLLHSFFSLGLWPWAAAVPAPEKAYHGTRFEALYSIFYNGRLLESCETEEGTEFLSTMHGVYCFPPDKSDKAEWYSKWTPLFGDGLFWAPMLELGTDPTKRVRKAKGRNRKRTDQWVFEYDGCRVEALLVRTR